MQLKAKYQQRDRLIAVLSHDGRLRVVAVHNTNTARTAQQKHGLRVPAALLLARLMSAGSLLASLLKGEERIILTVNSDGPLETIYAEALQVGEVRGYVRLAADHNGQAEDLHLGQGIFKVDKILYNHFKPMVGIVELRARDITSEFEYYLNQSEQINSAVLLDAEFDQGHLTNSYGLMIQAMPGADQSQVRQLYHTLSTNQQFWQQLSQGQVEQALRESLPFDCRLTNNTPIDFFCRCTLERFKALLRMLSIEELQEMAQEGQSELTCQYCQKKYILNRQELEALVAEKTAKTK